MLLISELTIGGKYRVNGTVTEDSSFSVLAKKDLKDGKVFILVQFSGKEPLPYVWGDYPPDFQTNYIVD